MMYPLLSILSGASGASSRIQLSDLPGGFETPLSVGLTLQTSRRSSNIACALSFTLFRASRSPRCARSTDACIP